MSPLALSWPPESFGELLALLGIIAAVFAGARKLNLWRRAVAARWAAMETLITRELTPDHGSSLKDDVTNTVAALHSTNQRVDQLHTTLHMLAESNQLIWPAIEAVAKATPPEEEEPRHVIP